MADNTSIGIAKAEEKKPQGGFFTHKDKPLPQGPPAGFADMITEVNNTSRRLRILEDRYSNIRDKMQFIEQNQITSGKTILAELRATEKDLLDMKRQIRDMDVKIIQLAAEVTQGSKKEDMMVLKRYIEMWQPLNFVTRNQVEKIVADIVDEKLKPKE